MASRWFRHVDGEEVGPVTFQGLVDMILAGTLAEEDLVRRESSAKWIRSREVIGLFHTAKRQRPAVPSDNSSREAPDGIPTVVTAPPSEPTSADPSKPRLLQPQDYWILAALVAFLLIVNLYCWWPESPGKFPPSRLRGPRTAAAPSSLPK